MYALFIAGNVVYNAAGLLLLHDLLQLQVFYLISAPILLSNIAYVLFVRALLEIDARNTPRLHLLSRALLVAFGGFALLSLALPHWSLELCRVGVALFLLFGLGAGIAQARKGSRTAALYLVANVAFVIPGFASIGLERLDGMHSLVLEHIGLVAVTLEVLLLALVQAYRHALVHKERERALRTAEHNLQIASTDALTGMPNRYALESALSRLQAQGSLTFIDLDGLKRYNDLYGHAQGDRLLRDFATYLAARLGPSATVHRLGGDEFGVTCVLGRIEAVEAAINATIRQLRALGYGFAGASFGSVRLHETPGHEHIKHVADLRMYEHKQRRRQRASALQTGSGRPVTTAEPSELQDLTLG
jgi:diguanylate cyclase (GGDEF)-like protein